MGNEVITWELLDTSGTMQFPAMQALNIARGDGFVLVYSVTDQDSFEEVKRLREQIVSSREQVIMCDVPRRRRISYPYIAPFST